MEELKYIPDSEKTYEKCLEYIKTNGWLLNYVPLHMRTIEMCFEAVK